VSPREAVKELQGAIARSVIGQQAVVDRVLLTLLCDGNLLLEGLPGLAKTRTIKALSKHLECEFRRIQFTPDLLPSDITGSEIYHSAEGGGGEFRFQAGPIFGNLILADEINRAPAKVQAALLEAMEERTVSVAGTTHRLPPLFMVLATQNPVDQEGTYPLPEAQMDRFLLHVMIRYPSEDAELEILRLVRGEAAAGDPGPPTQIPQQAIFDARAEIAAVGIAEPVERYITAIVTGTRDPARYSEDLARWITVGASPRGTIALDKVARGNAWLEGRDHATPDDVRAVVHDCLRHRLMLSYEAHAEGLSADDVIKQLVEQVAVA
jgi:MoxR-like ATPase